MAVRDAIRLGLFGWCVLNAVVIWLVVFLFRKSRSINAITLMSAVSLTLALLDAAKAEQIRIGQEPDYQLTSLSLLLALSLTLSNGRALWVWVVVAVSKRSPGPVLDSDIRSVYGS